MPACLPMILPFPFPFQGLTGGASAAAYLVVLQPHAVPMGEIGQQREDPPWSMKSNFLAKNLSMLSADENASFEDW